MSDRRTHAAALALALLLLPLLAACGDDDDSGPPPEAPEQTEALWNPCDALDAAGVGERFGARMTEEDGTPTSPSCTFTPATRLDPVLDANYQLFPEGLDAAWKTMGHSETAIVTSPKVSGADDTRLVVEADQGQLFVSGFVQNGDLIQTVDAIDPAPFDRRRMVRAVTWVLGELAARAHESGVS
jgi:hypothetical protein